MLREGSSAASQKITTVCSGRSPLPTTPSIRRGLSPVTPLSRVLETGAGTGIVTRRLRDLLPVTTRLIATDLNPPMLEIARKKFRSDEPIEFRHADAMALPFADGNFDAVVCQFSAQFFPD